MTPEQRHVLDFVRRTLLVAQTKPSVRDIARCLERPLSSTQRAINALVSDGHLLREPGKPRSLQMPAPRDLSGYSDAALAGELARRGRTLASLDPRAPTAVGYQRSCAADTCGVAVRRGHLMCRSHWFALSPELRAHILRSNAARDRVGFERAVTEARDLIDSGDWRARA